MKYFVLALSFFLLTTGCNNGKKTTESKAAKDKTAINSKEVKEASTASMAKNDVKQVDNAMSKEQLDKAKSIMAAVKEVDESVDGKNIFKIHCALCHGFKGDMMVNGAKDLTKSKVDIVNAVAQVYHGKGLMQPYKGLLSDAEIVSVTKYAQTLRK